MVASMIDPFTLLNVSKILWRLDYLQIPSPGP
jgi:hypothetical protein